MLNVSFERDKVYLEKANAMYEMLYGKSDPKNMNITKVKINNTTRTVV